MIQLRLQIRIKRPQIGFSILGLIKWLCTREKSTLLSTIKNAKYKLLDSNDSV